MSLSTTVEDPFNNIRLSKKECDPNLKNVSNSWGRPWLHSVANNNNFSKQVVHFPSWISKKLQQAWCRLRLMIHNGVIH